MGLRLNRFLWKTLDGKIRYLFPIMIRKIYIFDLKYFRFVLMVKHLTNVEPNELLNATDLNENDVSNTNKPLDEPYKMLTVLISGGNQNPVTIVIRKYQYGDSVAKYLIYFFVKLTKSNIKKFQ